MTRKVSKVTITDDTATTLAGILYTAECWATSPRQLKEARKIYDAGVPRLMTPEEIVVEVKRVLERSQHSEKEWQDVQTEPTRPARFPV